MRLYVFINGINPHLYCLPILKRCRDKEALLEAALSGKKNFFLGTDSAPHTVLNKLSCCGCAGIFSSPLAIPLLIQLFEEHSSLEKIDHFMSRNGRAFYGLRQHKDRVRYVKRSRYTNRFKNYINSKL